MTRPPDADDGPGGVNPALGVGGPLGPGQRFGNYVIRELIGAGGMGRVYRARHAALRRDVALKVLKPVGISMLEALSQFLEEARLVAAVQHPNVVQIFDVGVHEHWPFLAMELLEGEDLEARLRSQGALDEPALLALLLPIVSSLAAVHAAGIVHRDLKPGNIFLARLAGEEVPKLLDFGISRAGTQDAALAEGSGLRLIGTPLYMAPEVLLNDEASAASDQYSLGVILYECVTGVNPFAAATLRESTRRIVTGKRPRARDQVIHPSPGLAQVIERALELDPARRYPDLLALGQALLPFAERSTRTGWELKFGRAPPIRTQNTPVPPSGAAQPEQAPQSRERPWLPFVAALGWLIAAGIAIRELSRSDVDDGLVVRGSPMSEQPVLQNERSALRPPPPVPGSVQATPSAPAAADAGENTAAALPRHGVLEPTAWLRHALGLPAPDAGSADEPEPEPPPEQAPEQAPVRGTNNAPIFE